VRQDLLGAQGIATAQAAIAAMAERAITPTPENYAVWLCYIAKAKQALTTEIDNIISSGRTLDDRVCDSLYETFFEEHTTGSQLLRANGKIAAEMQDVVRDLKDVSQHTRVYGQQLKVAQSQLAGNSDRDNTMGVVETLVGATNVMASKSDKLEKRLEDSGREIETLREQLEIVRVQATTDALTGVANRKDFETKLEQMAAEADASGAPLNMIICDIDHFKRVNDTFGHQTGDQVIRFVATVMDRAKPKNGLVARIGGEEFALLAPATAKNDALAIAERIRTAVASKRLVRRASNEDLGQITVSLGVAQRVPQEATVEQIERADAALYDSKRSGRNKVSDEKPAKSGAAQAKAA
jgi:diguanylate cyclase